MQSGEKTMSDTRFEVLLIEDNEGDARLLREMLRESRGVSFELVCANRLSAGLDALRGGTIDMVLLDLSLPDSQGLDTLREVFRRTSDIPIVVMTGMEDETLALKAVQLGAQDYLVKGQMQSQPLIRAIISAAERHRLQRELEARAQQLQVNEGRFRGMIEKNVDGILVMDGDSVVRFVNPAAEILFARNSSGLVGETFGFPAASGETVELDIPVKGGGTTTVEMRTVDTEWEGEPAYIASLRDVTDRKHAESVLQKSREDLEQQVRQQDALLWISQAVQEMTQPSDLERVIQVCFEHLRNLEFDFHALVIQWLTDETAETFEAFETQPSGEIGRTHRMKAPDLYRIWQSGKTAYRPDLIEDMGGLTPGAMKGMNGRYGVSVRCILNVPHARGLLSLLSAQPNAFSKPDIRFAEQVAQEISVGLSRVQDLEHLAGLVRDLPEGICLLDGTCNLVFVNPVAQEHLEALGGAHVGDRVSCIGEKAIAEILAPSQGGVPHEVSLDGPSPRIFEMRASPVREHIAGGGWTLTIRDVTQERGTERKIQDQYRLAAVGQLAAGIAHDFNNLLTVMSGFSQILVMRDDLPASAKEELQSIFEQSHRAAQLIRQILDFSRKSEADRHAMDLVPFVKEAVKLIERALPETIRVVTAFDEGAYPVCANPPQLQQVFTNLAINARDAMPKGGELRIELSPLHIETAAASPLPDMAPGDWVVWTVSDTGTGIPPEVMAHIFEPFFTTKRPGEGTGLGLAQVYGLVKQHDGTMDVKSVEGEGTIFRIYLPQTADGPADVEVAELDLLKGRGETVLLVEDQVEVLQTARRMLEYMGYRALAASGGREALAAYDAHVDEVRLVLTDVVMPEMGGPELVEALRERDCDIPVVFMTGYAPDEAWLRQLPGVAGYLEKPLYVDSLARILHQALNRPESEP